MGKEERNQARDKEIKIMSEENITKEREKKTG
jgi:hypothetical protein